MHRQLSTVLATASLALLSTPALADHGIAGGGVSGSGPIVTLEADTLPAGKLAAGLSIKLTRPDAYSDTDLMALASQHIHAHTTDYNLGVTASLAYGLTDHFMLTAALPYVRREHLREGQHGHAGDGVFNTVEDLGTVTGIGDMSLIGQYVLRHDHAQGWAISAFAGVKVPTGSTHHIDQSGDRLETEHQPGTGSWDPLFGLAASKAAGRWSFHAGTQYQVSTKGAQDTRLGDRMNVSAAAVYLVSGEVPGSDEHESQPHRDPSSWSVMLEPSYEWEGRQKIAGVVEDESGAKVLWLSPGLRFSSPAGCTAAVSAGLPIWQEIGASHPDNSFRLIAQNGGELLAGVCPQRVVNGRGAMLFETRR